MERAENPASTLQRFNPEAGVAAGNQVDGRGKNDISANKQSAAQMAARSITGDLAVMNYPTSVSRLNKAAATEAVDQLCRTPFCF